MKGIGGANALLLLSVPVHLGLALATDLSPDEAYYLCAARLFGRSPGLVDHPPLLPWLLRLSDTFSPLPVELRVRLWPIFLSWLTGYLLLWLARERQAGDKGLLCAILLGQWTILPMAGGFVATPDTLLLPAFAVLLLWAGQAQAPSSKARFFAALIAAALGALSKVVMLPLGLAITLFAHRRPRIERFLVGAAMLCSLPFLWPSLLFQLRHAFVSSAQPSGIFPAFLFALHALLETVFVQMLLWTPWAFWHGLSGLRFLPSSDRAAFFGLTALVLLSAILRAVPPEANWWAPAALILLLGAAPAKADEVQKKALKKEDFALFAGVLLPTFIALLHTAHPFLPLPPHADPTARLHGWSQGIETPNAAGVGVYGPAAERCVYRNDCDEIRNYFNSLNNSLSSLF